jgi:hypothetical protein
MALAIGRLWSLSAAAAATPEDLDNKENGLHCRPFFV